MILRGLVLVAVILGGIFYNQMGESNLNELSKEQVIIKGINTFIDYLHFQPHDMDADYTDEVFRTYMKSLDSRKQFFTQEEVSQLREFMNQMDDQIDSYDLEFFHESCKLYKNAFNRAESFYKNIHQEQYYYDLIETLYSDQDTLELMS